MNKHTLLSNPYIKLHMAVLLAGGTGIFGRSIGLTEIPLVWYRMLIGMVCFCVIMAWERKLRRYPAQTVAKLFGTGVLLAVHWVSFYASIKYSNVSVGVVCIALDSFFTAICDPIISRRKLSVRELLISLLVLSGIVLLFGFDPRYRLGIAFGAFSSFIYALFAIYSKRVQSSDGVSSGNMLLYEMLSGWLFLTLIMPLYSWLSPHVPLVPTASDLGLLLVFGTLFTIGPFLLQLQALRSISAFTVNLSYNLEPIYSIVFAMIIFNEGREVNAYFWIGLAIIMSAVVLQTMLALRENRITRNKV